MAMPACGNAAVTEDNFQLRSTADLLALCTATTADPMGTAAINLCQGFAIGVYRVLVEVDAADRGGAMFCVPNPAPTRSQELARFTKWLQANPGELTQSPQDGIAAYLAQAHPCPGKK
jgi:hypothetical protein